MRRQRPSRLIRTNERQNKRQAMIFGVATLVLLVILIQFGPLLINVFGNVVYTLRGGDQADAPIVGNELLTPPDLIGVPDATQSARISFSGSVPYKEGSIEIYVNDQLSDEIDLDGEDFEVKGLGLKKGSNTIKARYRNDSKTSAFTEDFTVNYLSDKPKLEVSNPSDNSTFTKADKSIQVKGLTDPDNTVTVNSFRAIVNSEGEFTYQLQLNDGENQIMIEATNPAGISTQTSLKVTYQP